MSYRWLLALHLLAAIAFLSNAVAAWFWEGRARRSRDPRVVAHAFATLNAGDLWITPASAVALVGSGVYLAVETGTPLLGTGWLLWSIAAFAASGVLFAATVLPAQRRLARWTARATEPERFDWKRFEREERRWALWAHTSLGLALAALLLMLLKPSLPAL